MPFDIKVVFWLLAHRFHFSLVLSGYDLMSFGPICVICTCCREITVANLRFACHNFIPTMTFMSCSDRCVYQKTDGAGEIGVELRKNLVTVAGVALQRNLTKLGPLVLPVSEMLLFAINWVAIKVMGMKVKTYTPDFKQAFDHFCLHAGGRGVIEGLEKQLELPASKVEPNFQTLEW